MSMPLFKFEKISLDSILGILDDLIIVSLPICHRIDLEHMPVTMVDQKTSEGPTTVKQRNKSGEFKVCSLNFNSGLSDFHNCIAVQVNCTVNSHKKQTRLCRSFKDFDSENFI
jgi:hypothetical protein